MGLLPLPPVSRRAGLATSARVERLRSVAMSDQSTSARSAGGGLEAFLLENTAMIAPEG